MGATASLTALLMEAHTLADQGAAIRSAIPKATGSLPTSSPQSTILGGPSGLSGLGQMNARPRVWFRDRQFLFTYSPYTKESDHDEAGEKD